MTTGSFHPAATAEAERAVRRYESLVPGLGRDFAAAIGRALDEICGAPLTWPHSESDPRARRYLLPRFPYELVYVIRSDGAVVIAAVAHTARQPGYWRTRIGGASGSR